MPPADGGGPTLPQALALGLLHGPAELLPISSSAHTSLLPWLAGWSYVELDPAARKDFEAALHAGAGLALALRLRPWRGLLGRRRLGLIAAGIAPPALAGFAFERPIERRLGGPRATAVGLLAGAVALAGADRAGGAERREAARAGWRDGLALGLAQAVALAPGVSRNGAALAAARARGFGRADAHALSWAVGLPVILGPVLLRLSRRRSAAPAPPPRGTAGGAAAAFASSWLTAGALRHRRLRDGSLLPYAVYRCALASVVLAVRRRRAQ